MKPLLLALLASMLFQGISAQILFNDGKVKVTMSKYIAGSTVCDGENWYLAKVEVLISNNSENTIRIDQINCLFPSITSTTKNVGGSFHPCKGGFAPGNNSIIPGHLSNIFIKPYGTSNTLIMYAWVTTTAYEISHVFGYTSIKNNVTNNSGTKEQEKAIPKSPSQTNPQSVKTRYYVQNGELIIDNGDLREHKLIATMTTSEIREYETLSGLKLSPFNTSNTSNNSLNKPAATQQQTNSEQTKLQQEETQRQQAYEEFKRQQQEKQLREFNENIQRQNASNQRFNSRLNLATNFLLDVIQSVDNKKRLLGADIGSSIVEKINDKKYIIDYYKSDNNKTGVTYVIDNRKLFKKSLAYNINSDEITELYLPKYSELINFLTQDYMKNNDDEGNEYMRDTKSSVFITTPSYKGKIQIKTWNKFYTTRILNEFIKIKQLMFLTLWKQNGALDAEAQKGLSSNELLSNEIVFSLFDIYKIRDVSNLTESDGEGNMITYSNYQAQIQLSTGEYLNFTVDGDVRAFINRFESLLEESKKEYYDKIKLEMPVFKQEKLPIDVDSKSKRDQPIKYDFVSDLRNGYKKVRINEKWGLIDEAGKVVIAIKYNDVADCLCEGLAWVNQNGKVGYLDEMGNFVISPIYDSDVYPVDFDKMGVIPIKLNNKFGSIDKSGKVVVPFKYDCIGWLSEGLVSVNIGGNCIGGGGGKWGYSDLNGNIVIPVIFDWVGSFQNGKAKVKSEGREFFINKLGKEVK